METEHALINLISCDLFGNLASILCLWSRYSLYVHMYETEVSLRMGMRMSAFRLHDLK
jgi:hypothetical protein